MKAWKIRVSGLVQGVGFRPHIWRLAAKYDLKGTVLNDARGVEIVLFCNEKQRQNFELAMKQTAPLLARIDTVESTEINASAATEFTILASKSGRVGTGITPDAATCPDCLADVLDPKNRRYRYPFTNCTHCGPRLTITRKIPYDRANTAMDKFPMCAKCQAEYQDPADRRYHAQPNACAACGPRLKLVDRAGEAVTGDAIKTTASLIRAGKIVAIKGLGGFQLAVDALNGSSVARLRNRKHRPTKPLALMVRDTTVADTLAIMTPMCREELGRWQAPIVLVESKNVVATEVAPNQSRIGLMLPNTPLHHLLLIEVNRPIVLTSGNITGDPQIIANEVALEKLAHIADYFLLHDRDIVNRVDDSVLQPTSTGIQIIRRSRGFAPAPMALSAGLNNLPNTLAMGGDMKNTFCLFGQNSGIVSQHIGEMSSPATQRDFLENLELFQQLYDFKPKRIVVDQHPTYFSTRLGEALAAEKGIELVRVQHHHAHTVSVMAEYGISTDSAPVLAVVLDGLGYGSDGNIWGGEFLRVDYRSSVRLAHFPYVALLGGDKANHQPWRNLYAHLHAAFEGKEDWRVQFSDLITVKQLESKPLDMLDKMITRGINSPLSSSAGRLFDAVAALLNESFEQISYEGEAAMRLQALAEEEPNENGHYLAQASNPNTWFWLWDGILSDMEGGLSRSVIAKKFHNSFIEQIAQTVALINVKGSYKHVVLTGGVFQNRLMRHGLSDRLTALDIEVLMPRYLPPNDGGLSFGQAVIGALN